MSQRSEAESDLDSDDEAMAQTFALALKESGLTEREFADRLGASHDQVNRYKRNATRLPAKVLVRAARIVERTVDELIAQAIGTPEQTTQAERIRQLEIGYKRLAEMLESRPNGDPKN